MKRAGVLLNFASTQPSGQAALAVFVERLRQLGWSEGQNLRIEVRWNAGDAELAKIFAAQLIGLMPDVIMAATSTNLTMIRQVTSTVPIVFVSVSDPVEQGFVASAATMPQPSGGPHRRGDASRGTRSTAHRFGIDGTRAWTNSR
jgi:putative ABC transport system substrate-binding protein